MTRSPDPVTSGAGAAAYESERGHSIQSVTRGSRASNLYGRSPCFFLQFHLCLHGSFWGSVVSFLRRFPPLPPPTCSSCWIVTSRGGRCEQRRLPGLLWLVAVMASLLAGLSSPLTPAPAVFVNGSVLSPCPGESQGDPPRSCPPLCAPWRQRVARCQCALSSSALETSATQRF